MNKYIKYGLFFFAGLLLITSCDVMNTNPLESYDENLVWGSKSTADAFVFDACNSALGLYVGKYANIESYSPNGINSNLTNLDAFPTETSLSRSSDYGFNRFAILRKCNLIIEKAATSTGISDNDKLQLVAEGYFLRGIIFLDQARWMGRFVPITKVLTPESVNDFKTPLTKSIVESYDQILTDLQKAVDGLPETSLPGRANKYVAYAFMSRAAIQAYAYTKDAKYLQTCINASNAVINSGQYQLTSNYGDLFQDKGKFDKEIILGFYRLDQNTTVSTYAEMINVLPNIPPTDITNTGSTPLITGSAQLFNGWGTYFPVQGLVDQYLVKDAADGIAKPWDKTSQYLKSVDELDPNILKVGDFAAVVKTGWKVPEANDLGSNTKGQKIIRYGKVKDNSRINDIMYNNRDNRFYGTIVYDSCMWLYNQTVTTCCFGNLWAAVRGGQSDSWYTTASGYYWRKNVYEPSPTVYYSNKMNYHFVIARLGEMYMNLAECYLLKGDVQNAVVNLNKTRTTHGLISPSLANTLQDAWSDYIRERRCEMAYENDIYWSFLRWGKYGSFANEGKPAGDVIQALNRPVYKIQITKDRKQYFIAQIWRNGAWDRNFTVKRYLMPIPQAQIDKRTASGIIDEQNPGW